MKFLNIKNQTNKYQLFFKNVFLVKTYKFNFFLKKHKIKFISFYFKSFVKSRKIFKKKHNNVIRNIKNDSFKRNKNFNIIERFLRISMKNGNKLTSLKHFNDFVLIFFLLLKNENHLSKYFYYKIFINFLKNKKMFYDFNFIMYKSLVDFEPIFELKIKKLNKYLKSKLKRKFKIDLIYILKKNRFKYVLRLINFYISTLRIKTYSNRLVEVFTSLILDKENSFLWKRKTYIYNKALKTLFKKKL